MENDIKKQNDDFLKFLLRKSGVKGKDSVPKEKKRQKKIPVITDSNEKSQNKEEIVVDKRKKKS